MTLEEQIRCWRLGSQIRVTGKGLFAIEHTPWILNNAPACVATSRHTIQLFETAELRDVWITKRKFQPMTDRMVEAGWWDGETHYETEQQFYGRSFRCACCSWNRNGRHPAHRIFEVKGNEDAKTR